MSKSFHNFLIRLLSGFLTLAFSLNVGVVSPAYVYAAFETRQAEISEQGASFLQTLAPEYGTLKEFQPANPNQPFLIHIQDAHANPSAQKNIQNILQWIYENRQQKKVLIGLEGALGRIHPEYLEFSKDYPAISEEIVKDLHQKGELTGAELFAWDLLKRGAAHKEQGVEFAGIETPKLYRENITAYRELISRREEVEKSVEPLQKDLEIAKSRFLSPELKEFFREKSRRKEGDFGGPVPISALPRMDVYLNYLSRLVKEKLEIDLTDPLEQIRFPNYTRILASQHLNFDSGKAQIEKARLLQNLKSHKTFTKHQDLVASVSRLEFSATPRSVMESLFEWTLQHQIDMKLYPEFLKHAGSLILQSEIDSEELFQEMNRLEEKVTLKMAKTPEQKDLLVLIRQSELLHKLLHLELSRPELSHMKSQLSDFQPQKLAQQVAGLLKKSAAKLETNFFEQAISFYETAEKRDHALVDNFLSTFSKNSIQVLITGGFHTDGVTALLREKGFGYAVIQPKILEIGEKDLSFKVFTDQNAELSPYLTSNPLDTQQSLLLKEFLEIGFPALSKKISQNDFSKIAATTINQHPLFSENFQAEVPKSSFAGILSLRFKNGATRSLEGLNANRHAVPKAPLTLSSANFGELYPFKPRSESRFSPTGIDRDLITHIHKGESVPLSELVQEVVKLHGAAPSLSIDSIELNGKIESRKAAVMVQEGDWLRIFLNRSENRKEVSKLITLTLNAKSKSSQTIVGNLSAHYSSSKLEFSVSNAGGGRTSFKVNDLEDTGWKHLTDLPHVNGTNISVPPSKIYYRVNHFNEDSITLQFRHEGPLEWKKKLGFTETLEDENSGGLENDQPYSRFDGEQPPLGAFRSENRTPATTEVDLFEGAWGSLMEAAKIIKLDKFAPEILEKIRKPERVLEANFSVIRDDGEKEIFYGNRILFNSARGPAKGGIREDKSVSEAAANNQGKMLALQMVLKFPLVDISFGGAKGVIQVKRDISLYSLNELKEIMKAYVYAMEKEAKRQYEEATPGSLLRALGPRAFGPFVDIPAPDLNTSVVVDKSRNINLMDIFLEAFLAYEAGDANSRTSSVETSRTDPYLKNLKTNSNAPSHALAVVTGKSVERGGSLGRTEATGQGVFFTAVELLKSLPPGAIERLGFETRNIQNRTISIQGAGNVGMNAAENFAKGTSFVEGGARVNAISSIWGTLENEKGLDINEVKLFDKHMLDSRARFIHEGGKPSDFDFQSAAREFGQWNNDSGKWEDGTVFNSDPEHIFDIKSDFFIPAFREYQIHEKNVHRVIKTKKIIIEAANDPITPEADKILADHKIIVFPDIAANAGGATVSYFEYLQNLKNERWPEIIIQQLLEEKMSKATKQVLKAAEYYGVNYRTAAKIISLMRVVDAEIARNPEWSKQFSESNRPYIGYNESARPETIEQMRRLVARSEEEGGTLFKQFVNSENQRLEEEIKKIVTAVIDRKKAGEPIRWVLVGGPPTTGKTYVAKRIVELLKKEGYIASYLYESKDPLSGREARKADDSEILVVEGSNVFSDVNVGEHGVVPKEERYGIFVDTNPSFKLDGNVPLMASEMWLMAEILYRTKEKQKTALKVIQESKASRRNIIYHNYPMRKYADAYLNTYLGGYELPLLKNKLIEKLTEARLEAEGIQDLESLSRIDEFLTFLDQIPSVNPRGIIEWGSLLTQYLEPKDWVLLNYDFQETPETAELEAVKNIARERYGIPDGPLKNLITVESVAAYAKDFVKMNLLAAAQEDIAQAKFAAMRIGISEIKIADFSNSQSLAEYVGSLVQDDLNTLSNPRSEVRAQLIEALKPYYEMLSQGDDFSVRVPDVFLLLGNPDLRTFLEFSDLWKKKYKRVTIPIVLAGGQGRGTKPLLTKAISHYGKEKFSQSLRAVSEKEITDPQLYETDILRAIIALEGITHPQDTRIESESKPSRTTAENIEHTETVLVNILGNKSHPWIALVTDPALLERFKETMTAHALKKSLNWHIKKTKTYDRDFDTLSNQEIINLIGYLAGYPDKYTNKYKGLPNWKVHNELKGIQDVTKKNQDFTPLENLQAAFELFLDSLSVSYDPDSKTLIIDAEGKTKEAMPLKVPEAVERETLLKLIDSLNDTDKEVSVKAAKVLGEIGPNVRDVEPQVINMLGLLLMEFHADPKGQDYRTILQAIQQIESPQVSPSGLDGNESSLPKIMRSEMRNQMSLEEYLINQVLIPEDITRSEAAVAIIRLLENGYAKETILSKLKSKKDGFAPTLLSHELLVHLAWLVDNWQVYHFSPDRELNKSIQYYRNVQRSVERVNHALALGILKDVKIFDQVFIKDGQQMIEAIEAKDKNIATLILEEIFSHPSQKKGLNFNGVWGSGYSSFKVTPGVEQSSPRSETRNLAMDAIRNKYKIAAATLVKIWENFRDDRLASLAGNSSSLQSIPGLVGLLKEVKPGIYGAIDFGGSNLRVMLIELDGKGGVKKLATSSQKLSDQEMQGSAEALFAGIAEHFSELIDSLPKKHKSHLKEINLGFTYSYPVELEGALDHAIAGKLTKKLQAEGLEGANVGKLLQDAFNDRVRPYKVRAVVNDTLGTAITAWYQNLGKKLVTRVVAGMIKGTGHNGATAVPISESPKLMALLKNYPGLKKTFSPADSMWVISESGGYEVPPQYRTNGDRNLDSVTPNRGSQIFEKMNAGLYLGELARRDILSLIDDKELFSGKSFPVWSQDPYLSDKTETYFFFGVPVPEWILDLIPKSWYRLIFTKNLFTTEDMANISADKSPNLDRVKQVLRFVGSSAGTLEDRKKIKEVVDLIALRAARLSAVEALDYVLAVDPDLSKNETYGVAIDGTLYEKYPGFKENMEQAIEDMVEQIFGAENRDKAKKIVLFLAKDGSGIGAAIIAAIATAAAASSQEEAQTFEPQESHIQEGGPVAADQRFHPEEPALRVEDQMPSGRSESRNLVNIYESPEAFSDYFIKERMPEFFAARPNVEKYYRAYVMNFGQPEDRLQMREVSNLLLEGQGKKFEAWISGLSADAVLTAASLSDLLSDAQAKLFFGDSYLSINGRSLLRLIKEKFLLLVLEKETDEFNALTEAGAYSDHLGEFKLDDLDEGPVAVVKTLEEYPELERGQMDDLIIEGGLTAEFFGAGEASRLGLGNMFMMNFRQFLSVLDSDRKLEGLDPKKRAQYVGILKDQIQKFPLYADLTMGARFILQLRRDIEARVRARYSQKSQAEINEEIKKSLAKQKLSIVVNDTGVDEAVALLQANDFFGFSRENVYFTIQPKFEGVHPVFGETLSFEAHSRTRLVNGHGYPSMQKWFKQEAFSLSESGERLVLKESLVDVLYGKGAKLLKIYRINDMSNYEFDSDEIAGNAMDLPTLIETVHQLGGFESLDKPEVGAAQVVEALDNPTDQKGGLFLTTPSLAQKGLGFLTDSLTSKNKAWKDTLARISQRNGRGVPYNKMAQVYKLATLRSVKADGSFHGVPVSIRFREFDKDQPFQFAAETVTGDLTLSLPAAAVKVANRNIRDFKAAKEFPDLIDRFAKQNENFASVRSEVRDSVLGNGISGKLSLVSSLFEHNEIKSGLETVLKIIRENPAKKQEIISWLRDQIGAHQGSNAQELRLRTDYEDALNYAQGQRIGFIGGGAITTASILGQSHVIDAFYPSGLEKDTSALLRKQPIYGLDNFHKKGTYSETPYDLDQHDLEMGKLNDFVRNHQMIIIDRPIPSDLNYEEYEKWLLGYGNELGKALRNARNEGDHSRKIFILSAFVGVDTSQEFFVKIKHHAGVDEYEDLNFDVVYKPDFSALPSDENPNFTEPYAVFGLREGLSENEIAATKEMIQSLYDTDRLRGTELDFMNIRSAEQDKDALMTYLGTKYIMYNELSSVSQRSGADPNVIALGAGLDKRIQKLPMNPSLGVGGRLLMNLNWIKEMRLRQVKSVKNPRQLLESNVQKYLAATEKNDFLEHPTQLFDLPALLKDELPEELHLLFWLEVVLKTNERTQKNFQSRIEREVGDLRGKVVALIGVGYGGHFGQVTESPALNLIEWLINVKKVQRIIISDPDSEAAFLEWKQLYKRDDLDGKFSFKPAIYDAVKEASITIIATDSNEEINHLDPKLFAAAAKGKIIFDGINLLGLRSDGKQIYRLDEFNHPDFTYVGVGRPRNLTDSVIYTPQNYPVVKFQQKNVAVIGGGYVGLVTAANLAALGHRVHVVEIDPKKVQKLNQEDIEVPIYEPGLKEMLLAGRKKGLLTFTTNTADAMREATMVYVAVGTPQGGTGAIDLKYILEVTTQVGTAIQNGAGAKDIVVKSTVTPNTFDEMDSLLRGMGLVLGENYSIASNPEFLKEGSAIEDVTKPDRTMIGIYSGMPEEARKRLATELLELYQPILKGNPDQIFVVTDTASSSLSKYAANAFLAVSISLGNFLARDSALRGANYAEVRKVLQRDSRIGRFAFLYPGCGYGGSCFPKDVLALANESISSTGIPLGIVLLADQANDFFKTDSIYNALNLITDFPDAPKPYKGQIVPLLGLTFKAKTDDMRESPALSMIYELLKLGAAKVVVQSPIFTLPDAPSREDLLSNFYKSLRDIYQEKGHFLGLNDAQFYEAFTQEFGARLEFFDTAEEAITRFSKTTKVVFISTDWAQYKDLDFTNMNLLSNTLIYDQRGVLSDPQVRGILDAGLRYSRIGQTFQTHSQRSELRFAPSAPFVDLNVTTTTLHETIASAPALSLEEMDRYANPKILATGTVAGNLYRFNSVPERLLAAIVKAVLMPDLFANEIVNPVRVSIDQWVLSNQKNWNHQTALFDTTGSLPVHLVNVVKPNFRQVPPSVAIFLETAHQDDLITLVVDQPLSDVDARAFKKNFLASYHLEAQSDHLQIKGLEPQQKIGQAIANVVNNDLTHAVGIVGDSQEFFKELADKVSVRINKEGQLRPAKYFWVDPNYTMDIAILLTPIELRRQQSDKFESHNIVKKLGGHFNVTELMAQISLLVDTIRQIATNA